MPRRFKQLYLAVVAGGLAAGVFGLVYAFVLAPIGGSTPLKILQSIASGVLRAESFKSGAATAAFKIKYSLAVVLQGFVSHALLVGLPIAWCLHRYAFSPPAVAGKLCVRAHSPRLEFFHTRIRK